MKKIKFLTVTLIAILTAGLTVSCSNGKKQTATQASDLPKQKKEPQYVSFTENGKNGFKNAKGETVVPAEFDKLEVINNIVIATKNDEAFFFDEGRQVFDYGLTSYSVEDNFITAEKNNRMILYFYSTGLKVENIVSGTFNEGTFMCLLDDDTYAFYSEDGFTKISNLKSPICLQKVKDGCIYEIRFAFPLYNGDSFLICSQTGEQLYQINLTIWQRIATRYFERDTDEFNDYQYTYNYRINLDRCIQDHVEGKTLDRYPEE